MAHLPRRRFLQLGALAAGGAALSACGGGDPAAAPAAGPTGTAATGDITVWSWQGPASMMKKLVPGFQKAFPGVRVDVQDIGNPAIWDKITTGMAAGGLGLGDVLHIGVDYLPAYIEKFPGGLADLRPLGADRHRGAFAPGMWETVSRGGKVYALPWEANSAGFYYRADLFEKAGVDVAALGTWDEVIEAGVTLKKKTGVQLLGIDKPASQADSANLFQMLLQLQDSFYFDMQGNITLDTPQAVTALTIIKRLNDAGLVADMAGGWNTMMSSIKSGSVAVQSMPTWFGGIIEETAPDQKGKWQVRLPPAVTQGGKVAATVNSTHLAVAGTSKVKEAAFAFAEYVLTRPESQVAIYKGKGIAPALMSAYDDPVFHEPSAFFGGQKKGEIFLEALRKPSYVTNYSADYPRALKVVTDAQSKVLLKGADPAAVLKEAADLLAQQTGRKVVR
ncbi:sugar ABC transporter substrate-binding protein [Nonomuraea sp. SMC257]|uniref:Sugar ABC transporter substrate-binding protein n=1 Tax=Nonomuraea montanisoli TaxID=2741721 RepID=A0A7Y6I4V0_9ACTN|nr:sugar ABC transporter substrate-binding protein [Nonomuraea montanisoli]NUW31103.1 sugar ABC transporter substrate-binding protein [Nonomuraea montanisoli]